MSGVDLTGKTIIVTGAGGFFGGHLVRHLCAAGATVRAVVRYNSSSTTGSLEGLELPQLSVRQFDVRDEESLSALDVGAADPIYVHLAANISIPHSYACPDAHIHTNVLGTYNMLQHARRAGASRFIFISSSEVYGTAQTEFISERHPLVAQSPYAATKIAGEKLVESWARSFALPSLVVRPFNLYGPGQSQRAVIARIVAQALNGGDLMLGRLDTLRDFNFVGDTSAAIARLISVSDHLPPYDVVNIGTGAAVTIQHVIDEVSDILGRELKVSLAEDAMRPDASEVDRLCADTSHLEELIGPRELTPFRTGLSRVIDSLTDTGETRA